MKPFLKFALAAGTALAAFSAQSQTVTLRFHHFYTQQAMASVKVIQPWCDKIAKESAGGLKCQIFPSMSMGGTPSNLVDQVRDGVIDLTVTLPGYTAGRFPAMEVFELPFMVNAAEAAGRAAWDYHQKYAAREFAGTKMLAVWTHDEGYLHTRGKQVKTLADFRGLKLRAPTRQTNKLLARLGATPVGMPLGATVEAISKGVIDGFLLPWEIMPAVKLQEMVRYHTETDASRPALYSAVLIFGMNQAKYDSLPPELKAVIDRNSGQELSAQIGRTWDESKEAGRKPAVERGNTFHTVPAAELDGWAKAAAPLHEEYVADMSKRGLPGAQMLADARALLAKYKGDAAAK